MENCLLGRPSKVFKQGEDILEEFGKHEDIDFAYPTERRFNHYTEGKHVIKD